GGEVCDEPVEDDVQIHAQDVIRDVRPHPTGCLLLTQSRQYRLVQLGLSIGPPLTKCRIGADAAGDLQPGPEPGELLRVREDLPHHLDEPLLGDCPGHRGRVLVRQGQKQRVLVVEVMEDRTTAQAGGLLEATHGGALEAVLGKAVTRPGEDLVAPGVHVVLADPGHMTTLSSEYTTAVRGPPRRGKRNRAPPSQVKGYQPLIMLRRTNCRMPSLR